MKSIKHIKSFKKHPFYTIKTHILSSGTKCRKMSHNFLNNLGLPEFWIKLCVVVGGGEFTVVTLLEQTPTTKIVLLMVSWDSIKNNDC